MQITSFIEIAKFVRKEVLKKAKELELLFRIIQKTKQKIEKRAVILNSVNSQVFNKIRKWISRKKT